MNRTIAQSCVEKTLLRPPRISDVDTYQRAWALVIDYELYSMLDHPYGWVVAMWGPATFPLNACDQQEVLKWALDLGRIELAERISSTANVEMLITICRLYTPRYRRALYLALSHCEPSPSILRHVPTSMLLEAMYEHPTIKSHSNTLYDFVRPELIPTLAILCPPTDAVLRRTISNRPEVASLLHLVLFCKKSHIIKDTADVVEPGLVTMAYLDVAALRSSSALAIMMGGLGWHISTRTIPVLDNLPYAAAAVSIWPD
jgi:hypothetical protein